MQIREAFASSGGLPFDPFAIQLPSNDHLHDLGQASLTLPLLVPIGRMGSTQALGFSRRGLDLKSFLISHSLFAVRPSYVRIRWQLCGAAPGSVHSSASASVCCCPPYPVSSSDPPK